MRSVLLASVRSHLRRYVAVGLAVGIGVAFVVVTGAITSATRDGLSAGVGAPYEGADVVATGVDPGTLDEVHEAAADQGAELSVVGWTEVPVRPADGVAEDAYVGELPQITAPDGDAPAWPELVDGRLPAADGEALMDARAAEVAGVAPGDVVRVGEDAAAADVTVVGTGDAGPTVAANGLYLRWDDLRGLLDGTGDDLYVEALGWSGPGSVAEQAEQLGALVPEASVVPAQDHVDDLVVQANSGVDVLAVMLLLFAAVALFVAVLVIANTFAILFAQRRRELALLRCVGATRRQLRRAVRVEALVVGSAATLVGLLAGWALGLGVVALVRDRFPEAGLGQASAGWTWYAAAAAVGVLVTLVAAWLPTRRAVRVPPVAALGPDDEVRLASGAGRLRFVTGVLGVLGGGVLLAAAVGTESLPVMVAGGAVAFSGLVLLGPVVVPALIRLLGAGAAGVAGPTARLAAGNAVRDPRRTAAATASLLVGVTLTTAVLTGIASARSVTDAEMAAQHPLDATLTATAGILPDDAAARVAEVDGVDAAVEVPGAAGRVGDLGVLTLLAPDALDDLGSVALDPVAAGRVGADEIRLPTSALEAGLVPDRRLEVRVGDRSVALRPRVSEGFGEAALVSPEVLDQLAPDAGTGAVWLRAVDGTTGDDLASSVGAVAAAYDAEVTAGLANRDYVDLQLTIVTAAVVGLLGIAVLIALAGIANTLGLSVLERTRELALLRALGLSRARLRITLAVEGVLLAVVATILGVAVGVAFAWVGLQTLIAPVVAETPLVLPFGQLALVVLATAGAGLLAAVLPARRAARIAPAAGLTAD